MKTNIVPSSVWTKPLHFIAFGCGAGAMPIAPGTFGTLAAIPFYLLMTQVSIFTYFLLTLLSIFISIWICGKVAHELNVHDHSGICLDEIVGFFVTMFAAPLSLKNIVIGFILFRLFDIWKPFPIFYLDKKLKGGAGIVLDDILAGVYACVGLQLIIYYF